jgi:hypothetical protein
MTNFNSNVELIYSMPAVGATKTTTALQVVSGTGAGGTTAPAFQMALAQLWPVSQLIGKSLRFEAAGTYDAGAVTNLMGLYADTAQAAQSVQLGSTGAVTIPSNTVGAWRMSVEAECVGVSNAASNWVVEGAIKYGIANNAATAAVAEYMMGGANTLGVPGFAVLNPVQQYYWELWSTFGTAPTAFVCSKFKIYAEN